MLPGFAMNDIPDGSLINLVFTAQGAHADTTSSVFRADITNVLVSEQGPAVSLTARYPPFLIPVMYVVDIGSEKKMARVLASTNIARVTDTQARGDRTVGNHPRDTVSAKPITGTIRSRTKTKLAIPFLVGTGHPQPALVRFANTDVTPEAQNVLLRQRRDDTVLGSHDRLLARRSWSERRAA